MPVHVVDTAGLRESTDHIEQEGVRRAVGEMTHADRVLLVLDATLAEAEPSPAILARLPASVPRTIVCNKVDLTGEAPGLASADGNARVRISAKTGAGLDALKAHLMECMGYSGGDAGAISARARHLDALRRARAHFEEAERQLVTARAGELAAEELRA